MKPLTPAQQRVVDVMKGSIIVTDEWLAYKGLAKNYNHVVINHLENEYVRGGFDNNGL